MKRWGWREDEWAGGGGEGGTREQFSKMKNGCHHTVVSQKKFSKREGMEKLKIKICSKMV